MRLVDTAMVSVLLSDPLGALNVELLDVHVAISICAGVVYISTDFNRSSRFDHLLQNNVLLWLCLILL